MRRGFVASLMVLLGSGVTACTLGGGDDAGNVEGDGIRGGALYDSWWEEIGAEAPDIDHPLWASRPDSESNTRTGADTWRCKECHGWDYAGKDGAYGSGGHRTGIVGVLDTTKTPGEIVAMLADPDGHAYGSVLAAQDLEDLAVFVSDWTIDASEYIAADGSFIGDPMAGAETFASSCAACHGELGLNTMVVGGEPGFEDFPGFIADDNPPEFLHKIRFGQPGTAMPPMAAMPGVLGDLGAFAQTLPTEPEDDDDKEDDD